MDTLVRPQRGRPRHFDYKSKKEYHHNYYIANKDKWCGDYICDCGFVCSLVNKKRHFLSKYHLKKMETK